ncbi:Short-chain dehydrogenase TIC 32, chloroplastic [Cytospora mali]|uniref:Short-chain dehydrogenase TIC 32, chloroplastic n=1 Tax=Cytospora mali TaxID=578113 RepID=A0A194VLZ3_CYTMA|nr:Short-chain dehydrogenase TIC 32, chloroplastic [Valsa mali]
MTSNPSFDSETTGSEAAEALRAFIRGKTVVVTGISPAGIGASTALAIASQGPEALILASRTAHKLDHVAADIGQKYPSANVQKVTLDLSSLDSVREAAAQIDKLVDHVDVLINNAGVSSHTRDPIQTPGDTVVDLNFFTNHLGPFMLTNLLLPKLRAAANKQGASRGSTRIINLSSHGHQLSPIRFYDYQIHHYVYDGVPDSQKPPKGLSDGFLRLNDGYPGFIGYGQSKTANILHATELTRRLVKKGDSIIALSVHPGSIFTELSRHLDEEGLETIGKTAPGGKWMSLDQGAATTIVAAFDPKISELDIGGEVFGYFSDCQLGDHLLADHAKDPENAHMLYQESERMLGVKTDL